NNEDIITFFEGLGVELKEEDHGRMFPVSNRAQDVVDTLVRQLEKLRVEVLFERPRNQSAYRTRLYCKIVLSNR
ncbi:NAD(P)/FAD-dependent oxidoreductase, partial [Leptospira santarosai]|nr:NAD(P)/FAD-dependent oxidoreductase [Leptospira santarosai]